MSATYAVCTNEPPLSASMERFKLTRYHCNHDREEEEGHTCIAKPSDWIPRLNPITLFFRLSLFNCLGNTDLENAILTL